MTAQLRSPLRRAGWIFGSVAAGALLTARAEVTVLLSAPQTVVTNAVGSVWVVALNPDSQPAQHQFPTTLTGTLTALSWSEGVTLQLVETNAPTATIPAGGFERREYRFPVPRRSTGPVEVAVAELAGTRALVQLDTPRKLDPEGMLPDTFKPAPRHATYASAPPAPSPQESSVERFFKAHFSTYEPMYFIAGFDQPNAKFQLSFKYRIFNQDGWATQKLGPFSNLYVAYSQTSLWDWEAESAPFKDSSYRPEFHYAWHDIFRESDGPNWVRFDVESGLQHESNGRDGLSSRSLNIAYLRPRVVFGEPGGFQFSLAPRAWVYLGDAEGRHDLSNNPVGPGLKHYRGYFDLRSTVGWEDNLQLAALVRVGDSFDRANLTLDLTYPLARLPIGIFAGYFHVQYFTGYGESLIDYDLRSETVRFGFSLWR